MLPPFIIEQIRKREERDQVEREQPTIEMPLPQRPSPARTADHEEIDRGVFVIDLG